MKRNVYLKVVENIHILINNSRTVVLITVDRIEETAC